VNSISHNIKSAHCQHSKHRYGESILPPKDTAACGCEAGAIDDDQTALDEDGWNG